MSECIYFEEQDNIKYLTYKFGIIAIGRSFTTIFWVSGSIISHSPAVSNNIAGSNLRVPEFMATTFFHSFIVCGMEMRVLFPLVHTSGPREWGIAVMIGKLDLLSPRTRLARTAKTP